MKANIIVDISLSIPYLGKILVLKLWAKMLTVNLQKNMEDIVEFLQINTTVFNKLIVSRLVCIVEHAQGTQNNFTISLQ